MCRIYESGNCCSQQSGHLGRPGRVPTGRPQALPKPAQEEYSLAQGTFFFTMSGKLNL